MAAGTTRIEDEKSRRAAEVAEKVSHIIQDEIRRFFRFCAISLDCVYIGAESIDC